MPPIAKTHQARPGLFVLLAIALFPLLLSSCVKPPFAEIHHIGTSRLYYTDASKRHTLIKTDKSYLRICAEPSPDVKVNEEQEIDLDFNFALLATVNSSEKGDVGEQSGFTEGELAGRTPSVLLARELLFRFCEFAVNADLDRKTMVVLYKRMLSIIEKIATIEAKNTKVTIGDTLSTSETLKTLISATEAIASKTGGAAETKTVPPAAKQSSSSGQSGGDSSGGSGGDSSGQSGGDTSGGSGGDTSGGQSGGDSGSGN